uniref:Protein NO VEIN C-terminal domain-containing protein n=1 Tax=Cajanus cajan TaxID=3821 RepID=A0A151TL48_CAJCA|nr:hypothetical protein KK1_024134 [Cajanus cajan]
MQQVPSLHRLMITEGKVNAFVHCFVGVRRITSLYDLEVAICKNEGVDNFEALGLGPFLRHPLVIHYFSLRSDVTQVYKITSEEIIQLLCELWDGSRSNEIIKVEQFLEFIAMKRLVKCKEWLGIRIQNLGMHISAIREARNSEQLTLEKCLKTLNSKNEKFKKRPISSSQKKQLDERFNAITQRVESFSPVKKSLRGKHVRFMSSSSEDVDSDSSTDEQSNNPSSQFTKNSERVSSCPYPSATEEMARLGVRSDVVEDSPATRNLKNGFSEQPRKKRKSENVPSSNSAPCKSPKRGKFRCLSQPVLERMLQFYEVNRCRWKKIGKLFLSYPFIGLLNAAVSSIKSGMRNNIYDAFQAVIDNELSNSPAKCSEYETIDVGPSQENLPVITTCISSDDVISKIGTYFDLDNDIHRNSNKSLVQCRIMLLRKFCGCGNWVAEQFGVNNFDSLGYGDFLSFLEKHVNQLPHELLKLLVGDTCKNSSIEACMSSNQLTALVSQALSSLWESETVTKQMISMLLMRQFPSITLEVVENGSLVDLLDTAQGHKSSVTSKCVVFSATIIEKNYNGELLSPLVSWLLSDVNTKELLCIVTRDGKVIRIDHSATLDSFLEAAVQGSSFLTAVHLLSLISLVGGEKYVPLSLLKCHACHAFEVMFRNSLEEVKAKDDGNALHQFVLDCLGNLPAEFHSFASDVLLSGMQSVFKDAASAILCECSNMEQRLMLHEVGLSLGISEWINDYHALISNNTSDICSAGVSCIKESKTDIHTSLKHDQRTLDNSPIPEANMVTSLGASQLVEGCTKTTQAVDTEKSNDELNTGFLGNSFEHGEDMDAALVIESIRRDEFGLDSSLSYIDSCMLKKQHARLGRALHCLSQELYSQDSHFILELVTDAPEIHSNGFHVKFDISEGQIGFVLPTVVPPCDIGLLRRMVSTDTDSHDDNPWNTCILLPFRSHLSEGMAMNSVLTLFSDLHPSLLLFLHRLKCIKLRNFLNDTFIVMKKEILGDGIIKVSHGKEKMAWFVVSQKLQTNSIRFDVQTTEISMAFTLQESEDGYIPCLDQQPVFAFLPLRTYGLKFILQGDFVLPSSREEVDGDSPWNQSEPGKGLSAFMSFVPLVGEVHGFFSSLPRLIISKLRMMNCLLVEGDNNEWAPPCKVLRGWTEEVCNLIPDSMLLEHLGLRYLDKNIVLPDALAGALGIEEFGPNILVRVLSSLCHTKSGLISMDMNWLASCLNTLYVTMNKILMIEYVCFVMLHLNSTCSDFSSALMKWREFFEKIGVTDFAQIVQVDKSVADICDATFKQMMWDRGLISAESIVKDWESPEIVQLVSLLSKSGNLENCKYLLEVLDTLWDACYSNKTTGSFYFKSGGDGHPFKSNFICSLCDIQWVVSTMDDELHYPKDLFYDCETVRMILGDFAPYAVPKVKSERLVKDVGFKTSVTLGDILDVLKAWRKSKSPLKARYALCFDFASMTQMTKLYAFIWKEMASSKKKTMEDLVSGPFIFIPYSSVYDHDDAVCGTFVYPNEVYWHDSTGSVQQMEFHPQCSSSSYSPINKSLCNIYPSLRGFFVDECQVQEAPPLCSYIQILLQLSSVTLPSQAADKIFQVFLKWADGLKSGLLSAEDITYLKECLSKLEFPVLPTVQDKWVSLHPSFGLVCWCDDQKLKKEFKHSYNLDFLCFGELTEDDKEKVQEKISILMKSLGIPAISEVVTREPIYYGLADGTSKKSLINWTLPYAQRYIHKFHIDKYDQLKQSGFDIFNHLKVIVVEKLFYRNVIKTCGSVSKKRVECSCLLQGDILYTIKESDYHSLFMELSNLLLDGTSEVHFANFLHMITTMTESGSSEEQIEFFILNSQKVPKLPDEEPVWTLSSVSPLVEADNLNPSDDVPSVNDQIFPKRKTGVCSNWPPADWKTAPDFNYARANGFKTRPARISSFSEVNKDDDSASIISPPVCIEQGSVTVDWNIKEDPPAAFGKRDRLQTGTFDAAQARVTGRLGEFLACKYFVDKFGKTAVRWVNEVNETGLPYDLVIGEDNNKEFIEVKATRSPRKDWFNISVREWQLAKDRGESFSIAFVAIMANNVARITIFKDPVKLCQLGELQLAVMMPRQQQKQFAVVS